MKKTTPSLNYEKSLQNFCTAVLENKQTVSVYSSNYRGAHIQALRNIYLTVQHYLEPNIFSALALVYMQHYPSTQWDLNIYGKDFPELLAAQTKGSKAKETDWLLLAIIARIEYAISRAYYGYIREHEQITPYAKLMNNTEFILQLQKQHPYSKIADNLDINQTIKIRCAGTKIYIDNDLPKKLSQEKI